MATCRFHLQPGRSRGREWSYSLNEHDDSLEKVTTVKRVARIFRELTPQLRNKRNRSLVHRPTCLNFIIFYIAIIKKTLTIFLPQVVKIPGVKN